MGGEGAEGTVVLHKGLITPSGWNLPDFPAFVIMGGHLKSGQN